VAELRPHVDEIRAAGADLVIVGSGGPFFAKGFAEHLEMSHVTILSDERVRAYALAGFKRGMATLLHPRSAVNYLRALKKGFRQGRTRGDALQQGGVMVVRPDGSVAYRFASDASGDHPPPAEIVAAVKAG
jgi:hypothetical protein